VQRISSVQTAVTNTGTYCALQGDFPPAFGIGRVLYHGSILAVATINIVGGAGVTGGTLQPLILGSDGTYRSYGNAITAVVGALPLISILSPVTGVAVQITVAITGGSMYIETTGVIL
jgi:hypothetical protein